MTTYLVSKLRQHYRLQIAARLTAVTWDESLDLVFCTASGRPLDGRNVSRHFRRVLFEVGIPARRYYDLRHSAGTFLNAAGVDPRTIMLILGHSQISLTLNTYVHGSERLTRDAIVAMETILTGTD